MCLHTMIYYLHHPRGVRFAGMHARRYHSHLAACQLFLIAVEIGHCQQFAGVLPVG